MAIIPHGADTGKIGLPKAPEGALLAVIVLLSCSASFGLGFLAGKDMGVGKQGVIIEQTPISESLPSAVSASPQVSKTQKVSSAPKETTTKPAPVSTLTSGQYVASKNGTKYHLPWCPGAKAMNEENKIWFNSKEDAESAGYTPAANCKGI